MLDLALGQGDVGGESMMVTSVVGLNVCYRCRSDTRTGLIRVVSCAAEELFLARESSIGPRSGIFVTCQHLMEAFVRERI